MPNSKTQPTPARMTDAAVRGKTGKTWDEWFAFLDRAGCKSMTHKEIVERVATLARMTTFEHTPAALSG